MYRQEEISFFSDHHLPSVAQRAAILSRAWHSWSQMVKEDICATMARDFGVDSGLLCQVKFRYTVLAAAAENWRKVPLEKHLNTYVPAEERIRGIHYDKNGMAKGWFPEPRWYRWDEFNTDNETPQEILRNYCSHNEYCGDYDSDNDDEK